MTWNTAATMIRSLYGKQYVFLSDCNRLIYQAEAGLMDTDYV